MKHAEVIYETGSKSVLSYDDEAELRAFLSEHHRRAVAGDVGGPTGHPAERITKVLLYNNHPADYMVGGRVDAKNIRDLLEGMTDDTGTVDAMQLIAALRDEVSPVYPVDQGRHASMYKMNPANELSLSFLKDNDPDQLEGPGA